MSGDGGVVFLHGWGSRRHIARPDGEVRGFSCEALCGAWGQRESERFDLIDHECSDECPCGPEDQPVKRDDESMAWLRVHHALDGRK